jgi:hypothetical protein
VGPAREHGQVSRGQPGDPPPRGLAWSWEFDLDALLADAMPGPPAGRDCPAEENGCTAAEGDGPAAAGDCAAAEAAGADPDQEAVLDEILAARGAGRSREVTPGELAGRVAEAMAPGPGLAALLATTSAAGTSRRDLPSVAAGFRRIASWAQAAELAAIAQLAARSAAADEKAGLLDDGRPARIGPDATAQVSLALAMTHAGASAWTGLAVTLGWRLAATGAALSAGEIDLIRARLIADATSLLSDEAARAVEARILPSAGQRTTGQLRAALRTAVITADPAGAEQRRREAERRATIGLYADDEGTATLSGQHLPAILAAAAFARVTAMARARKASGSGGGIEAHRAQVMLGLLLGTLPDARWRG